MIENNKSQMVGKGRSVRSMGVGIKKKRGCYIILSFFLFLGLPGIKGNAAEGGYTEFLNDRNRPAADYSGDNREVFTIIEVIPHDACSVFPYMIDWKTEEEYNLNVPIGYDGVIYTTNNSGVGMMMETEGSKPSKPYSQIKKSLKRDFLPYYNIEFATWSNRESTAYWWRADDLDGNGKSIEEATKCENGYFEYVGENKGLYYINTKKVKDEVKAENGICYEMQALPRTGDEKGKGEYEVKGAKYYWAKDYNGLASYPTLDIQSKTKFNYELSFKEHTGDKQDAYKVYAASEKTGDYFVKLELGAEEDYEFETYKGGNYDKDGSSYVYAGIGKGSYIVKKELITSHNWNEVIFEYAGTEKGIYDVTFIYTGEESKSTILYEAKAKKVQNGSGRYALASTSLDKTIKTDATPIYMEKENGDYGKIITKIEFAGIDYKDELGNYADSVSDKPGARLGRDPYHNMEVGSWVFRELNDIPETEYTKLAEVTDKSSFEIGDRIYVNQQNRIYRYYNRNGFQNNEWFKLLCYMSLPGEPDIPYSDNSSGNGYDTNLTSSENLIKAKELLMGFDNTFRIEVLQRTPGALTKEEVEKAELVYISDFTGLESFVQNWNKISDYVERNGKQRLAPMKEGQNSSSLRFEDDLNNDVLLALYDRCIYKRECALMVHSDLQTHYMEDNRNASIKNLGKLIFFMDLMEEAQDFAFFIEGYKENSDSLNLILQSSGGESAGIEVWPKQLGTNKYGSPLEMYNLKREGDSFIDSYWTIYHFELPKESSLYDIITWRGKEYTSDNGSSRGKVLDGETKYFSGWNNPSNFDLNSLRNIWLILHNRQSSGKMYVQITNAGITMGEDTKRVIYADEFDPNTFLVTYKILLKGASSGMIPELKDSLIFFDDNDNGIYDAGEVYYENTEQKYDTEDNFHERNVRTGFEDDSSILNPKLLHPDMTMRKVVVQASNANGITASADVWVVVREGFNLN